MDRYSELEKIAQITATAYSTSVISKNGPAGSGLRAISVIIK